MISRDTAMTWARLARGCLGLGLAAACAPWGRALPPDPMTQLGTFSEGPLLAAVHVARGGPHAFAGAVLDWRADLKGADLAGADLAGADLAGVDLTTALLAGANLEGADCTDAILRGADCTGARFKGANLTRADLTGARLPEGLLTDPTVVLRETVGPGGMLLHPDPGPPAAGTAPAQAPPALRPPPRRPVPSTPEARQEGEAPAEWVPSDLRSFFSRKHPVGTIHLLALPEERGACIRLVNLPMGLGWLTKGASRVHVLRRDGHLSLWIGQEVQDLGAAGGRLWFTTTAGNLILRDLENLVPTASHPRLLPALQYHLPDAVLRHPGSLTLTRNKLWVIAGDGSLLYGLPLARMGPSLGKPGRSGGGSSIVPRDIGRISKVSTGPAGELLFLGEQGYGYADAVACLREGRGAADGVPCGGQPRRAILTRAGTIFFSSQGGELLFGFNRHTEENYQRGPFTKDRLRVGDVAEGPSGLIWFTEPMNNAVCRLDPVTCRIDRFPMPEPGLEPGLIVNGGNGLMYFTLEGGRRLGAIVADADGLDRPPRPRPSEASAASAPEAEGAPPRLSRKERARLRKREKAAAASSSSSSSSSSTAPAPATPAFESESSSDEEEAPSPAEGARVSPGPPAPPAVRMGHILREHGWGAPNDKGQFLETASATEIEGLIQETLARREAPLVLTVEGRWETHRTFGREVGFTLDARTGLWTPTATLRVVLSADRTTVLTAFPVRRQGSAWKRQD